MGGWRRGSVGEALRAFSSGSGYGVPALYSHQWASTRGNSPGHLLVRPAWCQYEHESMKIVALTHKVSPFTAIPSGFGPVTGLWLDYPLYLLMGTNQLKMVAPSLKRSLRGSVYPFFHPWHGHTAPYIY
jgi:hypothetical protein